MILTYKTVFPVSEVAEKITKILNSCGNVEANFEFENVIPRKCLIKIQIADDTSNQEILELGALIGTLDKYD